MKAYMKEIDKPDLGRAWEIVQEPGFIAGYRMRFSKVALSIQMKRINIYQEAEKEKGSRLDEYEIEKLDERISHAKLWLDQYAPADFVFKVQEETPEISLSSEQKNFLRALQTAYNENDKWSGEELHTHIHQIKKDLDIPAKEAFTSIYLSFLGKENGPQAGWLLASVDKDFFNKRIDEVTK
jgi:lysyl-tRNA synthetase class 1